MPSNLNDLKGDPVAYQAMERFFSEFRENLIDKQCHYRKSEWYVSNIQRRHAKTSNCLRFNDNLTN
jgi:hypothetical protein